MKQILRYVVIGLSAVVILSGPVALGDELILKDGSVIRGKILKEIPGQSYRILLKDSSEVVYTADKVESVTFGETNPPPLSLKSPDSTTEQQEAGARPKSWGAVEESRNAFDYSKGGSDNGDSGENVVKPWMIGIGLGEYGLFGAKVGLRPADLIGLEAGVGGYLWMVQYNTGYGNKQDKSGLSAQFGGQEHLYFTPRTQRNQHSINFGQYYTDSIGPSLSLAYGYERHSESGIGFNFSIGVWYPVGDYKKYLADKIKVNDRNIDVTIIPVYLELGMFF
ncbi:MAG: hypothetical protein PHW60_03550 [Kiritimatiellae bacterium]|nr:hypothetical protein [Kiritimatiellia bacterium]